jgi:hypothetical protein
MGTLPYNGTHSMMAHLVAWSAAIIRMETLIQAM